MSNVKMTPSDLVSKSGGSGSGGYASQSPGIAEIRLFEQQMGNRDYKPQDSRGPDKNKKPENKKPEEDKKAEEDKKPEDGKKPSADKGKLENKMDVLADQLRRMAANSSEDNESLKKSIVGGLSGEEQLLASGALSPTVFAAAGISGVENVAAIQTISEPQLNELVQQIIATAPADPTKGEVRITLAQVFPGTQISLQRNDEGVLMVNFLASGAAAYQQISSVQESLKRRLEVIEGKEVAIEVSDTKSGTADQVERAPNA